MARFVQNNAPLAPNEKIRQIRLVIMITSITCIITFYIFTNYIAINHYFPPFQSFFAAQAWCGILAALLSGSIALRNFLILRCLQRLEQRRIALAQDDLRWSSSAPGRAFLADVPETLQIIMRMNRAYIIFVAIFLFGYTTFVPIGMDIFPLSLLFTIPINVFIIIVAVSLWRARSVMEITQEACILRSEGGGNWGALRQRIAWSDVRLLACYTLPPILGRNVVQYELSSQREVMYWKQSSASSAAFSAWEPVSSREVYQQQMRLLIALIVEKTGLPLYDLSEERS